MAGCGTILYPERRGQKAGRIDAGVAVLDGIGLLLFIIPGVIAFAVDFATGAIYLPGTARGSLDLDAEDIRQVKFDPKQSDMASIERIIEQETGYEVDLSGGNVEITRLKSTDDMMARFAEVLPAIENTRTALSRK
jgi:hypothetical protein